MFADLKLDEKGYVQVWTHPQNGQEYEEYALPKDQSSYVRSEALAVVNGGYAPGIYARKKLVYAYACCLKR